MTTTPSDDEVFGRFKQSLIDMPFPSTTSNTVEANPIVEALTVIAGELHQINRFLERTFGAHDVGPVKECKRCAGQGDIAPGVPCSACDGSGKISAETI